MNRLVVLDPGHGGSDPGACANGLKEKDLVSSISKFCKQYLESNGIKVLQTRDIDKTISINERAAFANKHKAALFVSIHTNAGGGDGVEVIYSVTGGTSLKLAQSMVDSINQITGQNKRPREIYTKVNNEGHDYFGVIRQTNMPAVICECAFIDSKDVEIIDTTAERKLMGEAIGRAILNVLGIKVEQEVVKGTSILGPATATLEQCQEWAKSKKATQTFINNLPIYFKKCANVGINPVVAIVQYAKETGYGKFGGVLTEDFKNPCGLKIPAGGDCKDPEVHKRFATWEDGIKAHIDHLALYAGAEGYPKSDTLDPRHFSYLKGKCKTVEALSGNWSPSSTYGNDLVKMLKEVECIKVPIKDEYQESLKVLNQEGVVNTLQAWEDKEKININHVPQLIIKCANKILELKNE